ncbi:sulfotransferase domain-containing protein [Xanthomonas floridensis]|uniref:Aryl sulfotransferase n=1 Tax=Xanthomonas floridensis TaxID=1843580 RepID=A0A1A9M9F9_9XANT|nr:sulfotransferase domain-containing protein [Xanthomonas floridensis]MEA5125691.1 sulfotransferase domain-containing protein [Xanthomonas floridensis]MEA5133566.1 sulfotransferase domain-containing protein [Xanthomonas floridensis]OAG66691.1 aryl sulfotransferase [Xanthomonas floridensis]
MSGRGIVWLASYPKSGNTWVRCLIASLRNGGAAMHLDALAPALPNAASRAWLERHLAVDISDLTPAELHLLRGTAYRRCALQALSVLKVHDSYDPTLFPAAATLGIVYIVRDPRDVAPSWADHAGIDLDAAIRQLGESATTLSDTLSRYRPQARQRFGSWSEHVASWLHAPGRRLLVRYEDLLANPLQETARLARFLGLSTEPAHIAHAVAACRFEVLRDSEERHGFAERQHGQARFFRQGRAGAWRTTLSAPQAARVLAHHGPTMAWLGYPNA